MREYAARKRAAGEPLHKKRPTVSRACERCGQEFEARTDYVKIGKGRFCSADCHNSTQATGRAVDPEVRARWRSDGKQGSSRWRALRRARAALGLNGGSLVYVQGACVSCGFQFTGVGQAARYCSDRCREANRKSGFGISFLDRMFLYSRDRWMCHLCGLPVDPAADELSNVAASLDHVVPQSHGGSHELENLKLAHRICNSVRRDVPLYEFLTDAVVADLRARVEVSGFVAS